MGEETYPGLSVTAGNDTNAQLWNKLAQNTRAVRDRIQFHGALIEFDARFNVLRTMLETEDETEFGFILPMTKVRYDSDQFFKREKANELSVPNGFTYVEIMAAFSFPIGNWNLRIVKNETTEVARFSISDLGQAANQYRFGHLRVPLLQVTFGDRFSLFFNKEVASGLAPFQIDQDFIQGISGTILTVNATPNQGILMLRGIP